MGRLIKAWDQGMLGLRTGSRVLMIVPPSYGYGSQGNPQSNPPIKGTDTLAFVIDILGVG
jgi:peptidylprolyl isomerase